MTKIRVALREECNPLLLVCLRWVEAKKQHNIWLFHNKCVLLHRFKV